MKRYHSTRQPGAKIRCYESQKWSVSKSDSRQTRSWRGPRQGYRLMLSETCVAIPQWPFLFQGRVSQGGCPNDCSIYLYNNYGWRVSASELFSRVRRRQLGPRACEDGEAFIFFTREASLWERGNRDRDRRPLQALAQGRQGDERECIKISHGRMGVGHDSFFCFGWVWLGI